MHSQTRLTPMFNRQLLCLLVFDLCRCFRVMNTLWLWQWLWYLGTPAEQPDTHKYKHAHIHGMHTVTVTLTVIATVIIIHIQNTLTPRHLGWLWNKVNYNSALGTCWTLLLPGTHLRSCQSQQELYGRQMTNRGPLCRRFSAYELQPAVGCLLFPLFKDQMWDSWKQYSPESARKFLRSVCWNAVGNT